MPQRHGRDLRRIRMDVGGDRGHARPRPHVRHRQPADRPCRNRQNSQIHQRRPHIHPIPRTQRTKVLGKRPMVAIDLLRKRRAHQRGHRQTIHPDPKGKSLDQTAIPPRPQEAGNPRLTNLEEVGERRLQVSQRLLQWHAGHFVHVRVFSCFLPLGEHGAGLDVDDVFRPLVSFVVPIPENIEVRAESGMPL